MEIIRNILVHNTPEGNERPSSKDSSDGFPTRVELFEKVDYANYESINKDPY